MCVVEKAGFEPRTLGTEAERAASCGTAPVIMSNKGRLHASGLGDERPIKTGLYYVESGNYKPLRGNC